MDCRPGCGACCIAPSIATPLPGMPHGKPAGIPCVHLDDGFGCRLFGRPERPGFCATLQPEPGMCGASREEALSLLDLLEAATRP
jgi:Fe-S-cluster containining protein